MSITSLPRPLPEGGTAETTPQDIRITMIPDVLAYLDRKSAGCKKAPGRLRFEIMKFRGHVQHGQVIADEPVPLKDGTQVSIEASETAAVQPPRGSAEAILGSDARWHGDPTEVDRLLDELRREKQAEVEAEMQTWKEPDSTE